MLEVRGVAPGMWLRRQGDPDWQPGHCLERLAAPHGELLVRETPWHEERALPALRAPLEFDFEYVLVSHGDPVHDRAELERALDRPAWQG